MPSPRLRLARPDQADIRTAARQDHEHLGAARLSTAPALAVGRVDPGLAGAKGFPPLPGLDPGIAGEGKGGGKLREIFREPLGVMAGLVPAIHVLEHVPMSRTQHERQTRSAPSPACGGGLGWG